MVMNWGVPWYVWYIYIYVFIYLIVYHDFETKQDGIQRSIVLDNWVGNEHRGSSCSFGSMTGVWWFGDVPSSFSDSRHGSIGKNQPIWGWFLMHPMVIWGRVLTRLIQHLFKHSLIMVHWWSLLPIENMLNFGTPNNDSHTPSMASWWSTLAFGNHLNMTSLWCQFFFRYISQEKPKQLYGLNFKPHGI